MIFQPKSEIQTFFSPKIRWSPKKKKVFSKIESDFSAEIGNSNVFFAQNQVVSKTKKKKVFTDIEVSFSAGILRLRLVGGDASRNGAELFEIEADFSAKIVTFRLVGGDASPPPKSATGCKRLAQLRYFEKGCDLPGCIDAELGLANFLHFQRNTNSTVSCTKDLMFLINCRLSLLFLVFFCCYSFNFCNLIQKKFSEPLRMILVFLLKILQKYVLTFHEKNLATLGTKQLMLDVSVYAYVFLTNTFSAHH